VGQFLPDPLPEEIWGADPRAILAGAVWPFNPAQVEDGGFRVSGQWPYASGCTHASYLLAGSMVVENGAPRRGPTGAPEIRILWVPKEQAEILDTWDVMGLAGTGSHDFKLENTFVPEDHSFVFGPGQPRGRHFQGTLYHHPFQSLFAQPVSAVALGVAAGAIDHAIEAARTKVPALSQSPLAERPLFQLQLAEAYATAAAGRAWLHQVQEEAWDTTLDGGRVDTAQRNLLNLAAANATECARRATETIYLASGASANYNRSPIPRALRDIHAISQHAATAPLQFPNAGRILAGLEPDNPQLLI
jgi:alkylation response protein AidB-like acyl-CoA dehydrogenase